MKTTKTGEQTETKAQHTLGPWAIDRITDGRTGTLVRGNRMLSGAVAGIAVAKVMGYKYVGDEYEANARLIAAAPRMFDFIKSLAEKGDSKAADIIKEIYGNS